MSEQRQVPGLVGDKCQHGIDREAWCDWCNNGPEPEPVEPNQSEINDAIEEDVQDCQDSGFIFEPSRLESH